MDEIDFCGHKLFVTQLSNCEQDIIKILDELNNQKQDYSYSHFINNRWENIFLGSMQIPSVLPLLSKFLSITKSVYKQSFIIPHDLFGFPQNEYWFNITKPGESTGVHNHKNKSKISGVFYLDVPNNSGNIFFRMGKTHELEIPSITGKLILFPSPLNHFVTKNNSDLNRISLAFNCFTFPLKSEKINLGYQKNNYYR